MRQNMEGGRENDRSTMDSHGHNNELRSRGTRIDLRLFAADIEWRSPQLISA